MLQTILSGEGAVVTVAASAGEALHQLQGEPFDVLLADIGMPDEDGLALIRAIRGLSEPLNTLPAIAVTAYASLRDRELALEAGYGWHVAKPIDPAQLLIALSTAIAGRATGPTPGTDRFESQPPGGDPPDFARTAESDRPAQPLGLRSGPVPLSFIAAFHPVSRGQDSLRSVPSTPPPVTVSSIATRRRS